MQTSLKRCGLKFSSRKDMSAKFYGGGGGGGSRTFFSSKSNYLSSFFVFWSHGAQWLSDRVLDSRLRGRGFEPHWRHCLVSLSMTH